MKIFDWWEITNICIAGEWNAVAGFVSRREELEKLIEPHLSKKKTADVIRFRGETRYVNELESGSPIEQQVWSAIWGLQYIYRAELAIESGDAEAAARWAYGVGRSHTELQFATKLGVDAGFALSDIQRTRWNYQARGRITKIKAPDTLTLARALAKHAEKKNWLAATPAEIEKDGVEACGKTVSGWLKEAALSRADFVEKRQRGNR